MSAVGQDLIKHVRALAAENPDYIYESPYTDDDADNRHGVCVYFYNGCPSCLIGQALFKAGLVSGELEYTNNNHTGFLALVEGLGLELDKSELKWLGNVQRFQDSHYSWGNAVVMADEEELPPRRSWNVA